MIRGTCLRICSRDGRSPYVSTHAFCNRANSLGSYVKIASDKVSQNVPCHGCWVDDVVLVSRRIACKASRRTSAPGQTSRITDAQAPQHSSSTYTIARSAWLSTVRYYQKMLSRSVKTLASQAVRQRRTTRGAAPQLRICSSNGFVSIGFADAVNAEARTR